MDSVPPFALGLGVVVRFVHICSGFATAFGRGELGPSFPRSNARCTVDLEAWLPNGAAMAAAAEWILSA